MRKDQALTTISEIEKLSEEFGGPYSMSLQKIRRLVAALRSGAPMDSYFYEKLSSIESWSEIGLSTRKFEKHGGASQVRSFVLGDCMTLANLVKRHWPQ